MRHRGSSVQQVKLMEIQDTFDIKSVGVLVVPSFDLPPQGKWQSLNELVTIEIPDGRQIEAEALFSVFHLNISDPEVKANKRWKIVVSFKTLTKADLPIGSKVFVSKSAYEAVHGATA